MFEQILIIFNNFKSGSKKGVPPACSKTLNRRGGGSYCSCCYSCLIIFIQKNYWKHWKILNTIRKTFKNIGNYKKSEKKWSDLKTIKNIRKLLKCIKTHLKSIKTYLKNIENYLKSKKSFINMFREATKEPRSFLCINFTGQ